MNDAEKFEEAAHREAQNRHGHGMSLSEISDRVEFQAGAEWARDHLARQEPTDAEVLAALNAQGVIVSPKMHPAPSLDYWGERATEAMRAALVAAKEARGHEHEWRPKQNVTTKGYAMPAHEACTCGAAKEARA